MRSVRAVYLLLGAILAGFVAMLAAIVTLTPGGAQFGHEPQALIGPVVALVGLTALVWGLMVVWRNLAVIRGRVALRYFRSYASDAPAEWIERPTRAYMNLLELPLLFYVACLLMLVTGKFDGAQIALAWVFVLTRGIHAIIHIGFNHVPLRFAAFFAGSVTLGVLWIRFAAQNL
ncbi:MAG TPA: MAPEG family protein [Burkholderiales bacterium]|jgi:hypothetical protein|nr:MAPEG family protein [Burkholderiales bacterium]